MKFPARLPLLPLKDIVVFPQMILPVFVAEDICLQAVDFALANDKLIFLSAFRAEFSSPANMRQMAEAPELHVSLPPPFDVYDIGTVATVLRARKLPDGRTKVLVQGVQRAVVRELGASEPFPIVEVNPVVEQTTTEASASDCAKVMQSVRDLLQKMVGQGRSVSPDVVMILEEVHEPGKFSDLVASNLAMPIFEAQRVLGCTDPLVRLTKVHAVLSKEASSEPRRLAPPQADKSQREAFLREQLKAIRMELGETDANDELSDLRGKIEKAEMPKEALEETQRQMKRLERMNPDSSEATMARTYIEWMVDLPWNKRTESKIDLQGCERILNEDHFGLEKIKERILEYLAVRKLNPQLRGPILCFAGPPGVGKTSLGRSIARALDRKFARISLGGLRDEAEIRGHRRTYIGAQPGRIIQALRTAGTMNPVLMLDELDKITSDYKGDPASALLEVLDPEQNCNFSDHYLMVPFDLSQVIFLANANRLDAIPGPLRDRLEIIEVSGYCEDEKAEIAKQYIIPKALSQHGVPKELVTIPESAISLVINSYTRESGLRGLERQFSSITRKIARNIAEGDEKGRERKPVKVTPKVVRELLGEETYLPNEHNIAQPRVGVATGLAYTSSGGELLELEANLAPGKGGLALTGQLGDVMKESAHAALSYIKCHAEELGIAPEKFSTCDIHLHVPAGAIPKDGPSAGVAICVALVSALSGKPICQDLAMTGEISLHGRVLPVGGLREKILAAIRQGIPTVYVPEKNRSAIAELPQNIRRRIDIRYLSSIDGILGVCFASGAARAPGAEGKSGSAWSSETVAARGHEGFGASARS